MIWISIICVCAYALWYLVVGVIYVGLCVILKTHDVSELDIFLWPLDALIDFTCAIVFAVVLLGSIIKNLLNRRKRED